MINDMKICSECNNIYCIDEKGRHYCAHCKVEAVREWLKKTYEDYNEMEYLLYELDEILDIHGSTKVKTE